MKSHTIEEMAHLLGYVEGYLSVKFYHVLLLIPQIKEELVAKIVNWPLSVLRAFLQDDTPDPLQNSSNSIWTLLFPCAKNT